MIDVLQEDVAPALDLEVVPRLLAPHLVDRLVGELDDVEFVERDLGVREALFDPRLEGSPHVDAGVGHRLAPAAMRLEEIREFLHRRRVLAVGDVDHLAPRHVDEQADVVVAAPRRSLVGGDAPHLRQIKLLHRPPDVMFDDAPQARVVLAEQPRRIGDRHCLGQRQHEGLKQQLKPEPARAHGVTTLWTPHSGHLTLGVRACNSVRCWKKSRCRQVSSFVSWTAQPPRPHCAQANRLPRGKSTYKSSRPSTASNALRVTIHGDERPRANWKRSVSCIPSG